MKRRKRTSTLSSKRRDTLFIVLMLLPAILIVLWQIYYPVLRGIVMAFQNYNLYNLSKVKFIGFDNFKELLTPSPFNSFIRTIKNTVIWVFGSLIPQFLIGFAIAMLLRRAFRGPRCLSGCDLLSVGSFGVHHRHHVAVDVQWYIRRYHRMSCKNSD